MLWVNLLSISVRCYPEGIKDSRHLNITDTWNKPLSSLDYKEF